MDSVSRTQRLRHLSPAILIVVLASLCFSVGEGLRLRPFPSSTLASADSVEVIPSAKAAAQISLHKYGPLEVLTPIQKRNKRQAVELAGPPAPGARELHDHRSVFVVRKAFQFVSVSCVSRPAGRAPPFIS